jgi:hypothetical protein
MKFVKSKIKKSKESLSDKVRTGDRKVPKWMEIDPDEIKRKAAEQKEQMFSNRPPEFFLMPDESRNIRFRSDTPIACISQYSIPVGVTPAGNMRFDKFTAPEEGEEDLFAEAGKQSSFRAIYEIIDLTGYKHKKKGRIKNIPRFWNVAMREYEAFEVMRKKYGSLTGREFSVTKTGSGKQSSLTIMPDDPSSLASELKALPRLSKDFTKYYAPPDEKKQRQLLKRKFDEDDD